jgi:SNF2 family DNA or RNA helicase
VSLQHRKSLEPWLFDSIEYYPHQLDGVRRMLRQQSLILADDMGLGKTLQALTVYAADVARTTPEQQWAKNAIVVCPAGLLGNWYDEIKNFTRFPVMICGIEYDDHGRTKKLPPKKRAAQLAAFMNIEGPQSASGWTPKIMVVNYELMVQHVADFNTMEFSHKFADEAHLIKNPRAKRTIAWHKLRAPRAFPMTGTPMLNKVDELWSLLHTVAPMEFPKYWGFVNRYAVFGGYQDKSIVGIKNEKELRERLSRWMLRRMKSEVLNLPEVQIIKHRVDLLADQRRIYEQIKNELHVERVDLDAPEEIENALTKFLRLKQVCGTTLSFNGKDISAKLDQVVEDVLQVSNNGHKCVVFTQFRDVLEQFAIRLDAASPSTKIWELHGDVDKGERQAVVKDWSGPNATGQNAIGEVVEFGNVIVCMLQVAGVGLNMTAARHGFFIDKLFTPGMNQQAIDRMHRIGADDTQPVQIHEYMCRGTIESRVEAILQTKSNLIGMTVNDSDLKRKLIAALQEEDDAA